MINRLLAIFQQLAGASEKSIFGCLLDKLENKTTTLIKNNKTGGALTGVQRAAKVKTCIVLICVFVSYVQPTALLFLFA